MKGFGDQVKSKKKLNYYLTEKKYNQILNEAIKNHSSGNLTEASKYYQYLIKDGFKDERVFNNYGIILILLGKLKEAELSIRKAIELNPNNESSYLNLGGILNDLGKFKEAEIVIRKAIKLNQNNAAAYSNLGGTLKELGKLKEAEIVIRKAIKLNPHLADAHYNLGYVLKELGNLREAEVSTRKAIEIKPDLPNAHMNLGFILSDLGKLEDAELSTLKAIKLNPKDLGLCYQNLSLLYFSKGNKDLALENIKKAVSIDPHSKDNQLLELIFKKNKHLNYEENYSSYPVTLNEKVDPELINALYKIKSLDLNKFSDPSFGNARGSDYKLFEDNEIITQKLKEQLIAITKGIVKQNVFFRDSFFTILGGESTINKHNHLGRLDKFRNLNLSEHKYSLVYYLSIGDQNCQHPGILKFYQDQHDENACEEILPTEGMIVIFPADRYHSVKYNGTKDRIIIGVNFYSI